MTVRLRPATTFALLALGCNDSPDGDSGLENNSTLVDDTSIPLACNDAVTWDSWAHGFFLNWCTSCHSSALVTEEERQKAPLAMNYDTYAGVVKSADKILYRAVTAEPKYLMPPIGGPSDEEGEVLRLWIECGLKEH